MKNYLFRISYDGTSFSGFQKQSKGRTVAGELRECLEQLFGSYKSFTGCSRTDSGVHANDYAFSVKLETTISPQKLVIVLNGRLGPDVRVKSCEVVEDGFNARYDVVKKEYRYNIYVGEEESPFLSRYSLGYGRVLDLNRLNEIAALFVGMHDFKAFQASGSTVKDTNRTIFDCHFEYFEDLKIVSMFISGNGFLYKMVRLITGAVINCYEGRISEEDIKKMIDTGVSIKPYAVEGKGLFLNKVYYD